MVSRPGHPFQRGHRSLDPATSSFTPFLLLNDGLVGKCAENRQQRGNTEGPTKASLTHPVWGSWWRISIGLRPAHQQGPQSHKLCSVKGKVTTARSVYEQSHQHGHHSRETQMSLEKLGRIRNKHGPNLNNSAQVGEKNKLFHPRSSRYCGSGVTCHGPRGAEDGGWRMGGG